MTYGSVPYLLRPLSRIAIGTLGFNKSTIDQAFATFDTFVELGGNLVDTAHCYGPEHQNVVGEYLRARGRDTLVLFDKGCHPYSGRKRVTREDMENDICENHKRFGFDKTDFFVLHRDDLDVPVGEIVEWLNDFTKQGLIQVFGGSNWTHQRVNEANRYAEEHALQGFSVSSPNVALGVPNEPMWAGALSIDQDARRWYQETQFPVVSWSSGAAGFFAGVDKPDVHRVYDNEENFRRKARAEELAKKHGVSTTQIAVAWVLNQPLNVFAIIGPRNPEEVRESLAVVELGLTPEELQYLEFGAK